MKIHAVKLICGLLGVVACCFSSQVFSMCYLVYDHDGSILYKSNTPPVNIEGSISTALHARYPGAHMVIAHDADASCVEKDFAMMFVKYANNSGTSSGGGDIEGKIARIKKSTEQCTKPHYVIEHLSECSPEKLTEALNEIRKLRREQAGDDPEKQAELSRKFAEGNARINANNQRAFEYARQQLKNLNTNSRLGFNNEDTYYKGASGTKYKYDLSNPLDRIRYQTDVNAQLQDRIHMPVTPGISIDRNIGQQGAGVVR